MRLLQVLAIITAATAVCGLVTAYCGYIDREQAPDNTFGSWTSELWSQTSGADFQKDLAWQADVVAGTGDAMLAADAMSVSSSTGSKVAAMLAPVATVTPKPTAAPTPTVTPIPTATQKPAVTQIPQPASASAYCSAGALTSIVLDTGIKGAAWDALFWDETRPSSTGIAFWVRASDSAFGPDDKSIAWIAIAKTSSVTAGLPAGRYKQWRVNMTTSDTSLTPVLHEVRVWYH